MVKKTEGSILCMEVGILLPMIFNVLTFDLMALLMLSMGEPRRVAWSGLTTQSSCAAVNIVSLV